MLAILLDAEVPEDEAVMLAAQSTANVVFINRARLVAQELRQGVKLTEAIRGLDAAGEFRWRLTNAVHAQGGFGVAMAGWRDALDAKAFQQEQAASHAIRTALVLSNGLLVSLAGVSMFRDVGHDHSRGHAMVSGNSSASFAKLRCSGAVMLELVVAISILAVAVIPLGFLIAQERQLCRAYYYHAVAMEIVDGEMEALVAGEWRAFQQGEQPYPVRAAAAKNLPPGRFVLTLWEKRATLQWLPEKPGMGGTVVREAVVR